MQNVLHFMRGCFSGDKITTKMFGFDKNKFLGVDIGTSTVKIVEIEMKDSRPFLSNYAHMKMSTEGNTAVSLPDVALPFYLKKIVKEAKIKSRDAYMAIPAFGGLVTLIEFPEMAKEDLDQAIRFEAHKYIPTSLDDVVVSWDVVSKKSEGSLIKKEITAMQTGEAKIQVLLVVAPKNKVSKCEQLVKEANLKLKSIEIESFALLRSLIGNDLGNFIVIDIGARVCNIILIEKGVIKVNRNIDAGGKDITKTIAQSMNIEEARAERMKISGKDFLSRASGISFPVLDLIIGEVKRVLEAYYKSEGKSKIDSIVLSGGTAGLLGIDKYFSDSIGIRTVIGDPLRRIEYDNALEPKLKLIKSQLAVSIGLALKGAEEYLRK